MNDKYKRLGINSLLVFIGSIGSKLLSILMLPFYTAWLSVENYGDVDLIATYVSLIMGVVTLCMTDAIFRFPQGKTFEVQRSFFTSGIITVVFSLFLFGVVYSILLHVKDRNFWGIFGEYAEYIYIMLFLNFMQLYFQQFSRSINRMSAFVVSGILLTLMTALFSLLLVPKFGVIGFLYSQYLGYFSASAYTFIKLRLYTYFSIYSTSFSVIKEMLKYSVPMIPNATLWWILGTSNRLFLEHYHDTDSVGIFAVSNRFPSVITMVFNTFFLSWQISVLEEFKKHDFEAFYNKVIKLCFLLLFLVELLLIFMSYWLVKIFADVNYIEAWRYIPFLGLAATFSSLSLFLGTIFMATKTTRYFLTTSILGSVLCLLLNFVLIPKYGIMGATISLLVAHFVILCSRMQKTERFVTINHKGNYLVQILLLITSAVSFVYIEITVFKFFIALLLMVSFILLNLRDLKDLKVELYKMVKRKL